MKFVGKEIKMLDKMLLPVVKHAAMVSLYGFPSFQFIATTNSH
jgi:hypothetical protein